MSLATIEKKLDAIIEKSGAEKQPADKSQEELDEERLKEIEQKLTDLIELIHAKVTRESLDKDVETHRKRVESTKGESRPYTQIYHEHGSSGKKIPTTRRTSSKMHLVDSLKMQLRVSKHPKDLEHALHILVQEQLEILERQTKRQKSDKPSST